MDKTCRKAASVTLKHKCGDVTIHHKEMGCENAVIYIYIYIHIALI